MDQKDFLLEVRQPKSHVPVLMPDSSLSYSKVLPLMARCFSHHCLGSNPDQRM